MKNFHYEKIFTEQSSLDEEISQLERAGYLIREFPADLQNKEEVFKFVKTTFPLDPVLESGNNWDALSDSVGGGMEQFRNIGVMVIVKYMHSNEKHSSVAALEFIEILFHIKKYQLLEKMRIFSYSPP